MVNKVILIGRLGRDPETRYTADKQAVANFSVATDETYEGRNGESHKRTVWHKVILWGKQAELVKQYLTKGSLIFVEGRIQSREWQDKEGGKRNAFEIVATHFRRLEAKTGGNTKVDSNAKPEEPSAAPESTYIPSDEDIPF